MDTFRIFIVEDDKVYGEMLKYHLGLNPEHEVVLFGNGKECLKNLYRKPHMISLDYSLPDLTGEEVIQKVRDFDPDLPLVVVSGQEDIGTAVSLLKEGVYDYIVKDEETRERLWNTVRNLRERLSLKREISELREEVGRKYAFSKVIQGHSPALRHVFNLMEKAVTTNITVSVSGETGTGKDLVAKAIHYNSRRAEKPFIAINVTAIPRELIESEMFGHEKGSFTGAHARKIGKFEAAGEGTIFLDEIAEMELSLQAKLLRVLQEKEFSRVGGNEVLPVKARLIVATNKNLAEEVRKGHFREDLYYRLLGLPIELPPLRQRGNDILILAKYFMDEFCRENAMEARGLSPEAQEKLLGYHFPGNVRELKAMVELAVVMANTSTVQAGDISFTTTQVHHDFLMEENTLQGYTNQIISTYLQRYNKNVKLVAEKLDVGKSTIYRLIKNKEIEL